jgi:PA14 domain
MNRRLVLLLLMFVALRGTARPGLVKTRDGQNFDGEIQFTNALILVNGTNIVALTNLASLTFDASAASAAFPGGKGNGLLGLYFGKTNFEGSVFVRLDETIDFDWAAGEPAPGVPKDSFGVIWTGELEVPTNGNYTFHLAADDIGQLYLEDKPVVQSKGAGAEGKSEPMPLEAGKRYLLKLTCLDVAGPAGVHLSWSAHALPKSIIPKDRLYARSLLPGHASDALSSQGLLATYYKTPGLGGETLTRVDAEVNFNWQDRDPAAGFPRTNFGVRWTGQVQADHSEDYTLYVLSDEPMRVWIDNRLLIIPSAQFYLTETKETVPLLAGARHDIRVEAQSTRATATFRLMWSSVSTAKAVIPSTHLFPSEPSNARSAPVEKNEKLPPGILLRNGTFIAGRVERATESSLKTGGLLHKTSLSTINVARILCQPLPPALAARIPAGRTGLLLSRGDFVDAEFRGMDGDQIKVTSILFGPRSYSASKDVLAVVLRDVNAIAVPYEVRLRDQSLLRLSELLVEPGTAMMRDAVLGKISVPMSELVYLRRAL